MGKAILLKDPETGLLWLEHNNRNYEGFVKLSNGRCLDLAKCEAVEAEFVSAVQFQERMSRFLLVFRNENYHYTVLTLYHDTRDEGGTYASITSGFTFKSLYGFVQGEILNIVAENLNGDWGMYSIITNKSSWITEDDRPCFLPIETVWFDYPDLDSVLKVANAQISVGKIVERYGDFLCGDLTITDTGNGVSSDFDAGNVTPEDYLKRRG